MAEIKCIKRNLVVKILDKQALDSEEAILSEIFKIEDCNKFSLFFKGTKDDTLTIQIQYGFYDEDKKEYYFSELEDLSPTKVEDHPCSGNWEYVAYEVIPCQIIRLAFTGDSDGMTLYGLFFVPNNKNYGDFIY